MSLPDPFFPYTGTARTTTTATTQRFSSSRYNNNNPFLNNNNNNNKQLPSPPQLQPQPQLLFNREKHQPIRFTTLSDPNSQQLTADENELYDTKGLYKLGAQKVFTARLLNALGAVSLLSWVAAWISGPSDRKSWFSVRALLTPISGRTLVATTWILTGLAFLFLYRIRHRNVVRMVEPNVIKEALRRMSRPFILLCACQVVSAYFIITAYLDNNNVEDARKLYQYPEGRYGAAQLNPSNVFSQAFICAIAVAYAWNHVSSGKDTIKFPSITMKPIAAIRSRMPSAVMHGVQFAIKFSCLFATFWLFFGGLWYRFAEAFYGRILRFAIVTDPNAGFYSILPTFLVFAQTTLAAMLACVLWNTLHDIMDVIFTQPMTQPGRSISASDENDRLIAGLKMKKNPLLRHHAFLELYILSANSPGRRSEIFKDLACKQTAWKRILDECLSVVRDMTGSLSAEQPVSRSVNRGGMIDETIPLNKIASAPTILPPSPATVERQLNSPSSKSIRPVRSKEIFSPPRKPNNIVLSTASNLISLITAPPPPPIRLPEQPIQRQVSKSGKATDRVGTIGSRWTMKLYRMAEKSALGKRFLCVDSARYSRMLFREVQLVVWAARAVSNLTAASIIEDDFGAVQRDVPEILETLLTCLSVVEEFTRKHSMSGHGGPARGPGIGKGVGKGVNDGSNAKMPAPPASQAIVDVLQQCIYQIVVTFHAHLSEFKFPLPLKEKLQPFIEFRAGV